MRLTSATRKDTGVYPGDGVVGRERAIWYSVTQLKVFSGGIEVADLGAFPGDSFRFRVVNGLYAIEARLIDFSGSLCVSRVRARLEKATPALGRKRGDIPVDFGAIAIADMERVRRELDDYEQQDLNEEAREFMTVEFCEKCRVMLGRRTIHLAVCKSGFGDGVYPVFPLIHRGRTVGLEVELIRDGHKLACKSKRKTSNELTVDQDRAQRFPPPPAPPGARRARRHYFLTGEETLLCYLREHGEATTQDLQRHWASEARGGSADRVLSKLFREKKIRRTALEGQRGSRFSAA